MNASGYRDVDLVLTTREIARLFKMAGICPEQLAGANFDPWMGEYSGAAVLFGASGGVMEAALRTVHEVATGEDLEHIEFTALRGREGIREAEIEIEGNTVRVAVVDGLGNARSLMEEVRQGSCPYHFIEVMACPGGCIGGGGQPISPTKQERIERVQAIYGEDRAMAVRKSHENQEVLQLYDGYLEEPLGDKSHVLLHTSYMERADRY
jgi:NADH-quinone oxidoreductase subunit G